MHVFFRTQRGGSLVLCTCNTGVPGVEQEWTSAALSLYLPKNIMLYKSYNSNQLSPTGIEFCDVIEVRFLES